MATPASTTVNSGSTPQSSMRIDSSIDSAGRVSATATRVDSTTSTLTSATGDTPAADPNASTGIFGCIGSTMTFIKEIPGKIWGAIMGVFSYIASCFGASTTPPAPTPFQQATAFVTNVDGVLASGLDHYNTLPQPIKDAVITAIGRNIEYTDADSNDVDPAGDAGVAIAQNYIRDNMPAVKAAVQEWIRTNPEAPATATTTTP